MKRIYFTLLCLLASCALLVPGVRAQVPRQTQFSFSLTAVGQRMPTIQLDGVLQTCSIVIYNSGGGFTLTPQVASDGIGNPTPTWVTATSINSGAISATGTFTGNVTAQGITSFGGVLSSLTSGTVTGVASCSAALGFQPVSPAPGSSGYIIGYPSPFPSPQQVFANTNLRPVFNAAAYGASTSLSNNATAINAAVTAAIAAGGGMVYLPPASSCYVVTSTVSVTGDNVQIVGDGPEVPLAVAVPSTRPSNAPTFSCIKWNGSSAGTIMQAISTSSSLQYIARFGLHNIVLDANGGLAAIGLDLEGVIGGNISNDSTLGGFTTAAIQCMGVNSGNAVSNCQGNHFDTLNMDQSGSGSGNCLLLSGLTAGEDADYNTVNNVACATGSNSTITNVYFGYADSNVAENIHSPGSGHSVFFGCGSVSNTAYYEGGGSAGPGALGTTSCTGTGPNKPSSGNRILGWDNNANPQPTPSSEAGTYISYVSSTGHFGDTILDVVGGGTSSQQIKIFDINSTDTAPNKFIRMNGTAGNLQILNSAFSATIWNLSDTGSLWVPAGIQPNGSTGGYDAEVEPQASPTIHPKIITFNAAVNGPNTALTFPNSFTYASATSYQCNVQMREAVAASAGYTRTAATQITVYPSPAATATADVTCVGN